MGQIRNPHPGDILKEEFLNEIGMSQNQLAHAIGVPGNRIHAIVNGTRDITTDQVPGKRSPGSLSWGGINNTYFWIDPNRGIAGVILMQYLPFADIKALAAYDAFERSAYQLVSAER